MLFSACSRYWRFSLTGCECPWLLEGGGLVTWGTVASFLLVLFSQRVFAKIESWVGRLWQSPFKLTMPTIGTHKLSCATLSPADQEKVRSTYSQVVRALSELAHETRFVTSYVLEVNATLAEAQPIPLVQVEAEIFAHADANADANADHHTCDICGEVPPRREVDKERGLCFECAGHLDEGIKYYTEDFAFASIHGKDALRLLVLRQRADNCRDLIAAAAGSYDGYLEEHEASVEEKMLNKLAAKCLARLPASFAPWWKDTWTHEKWCQMASARDEVGWAVEKEAPTEQHEVCKLKAEHAEVLANIERAREEDMQAVEARWKREMEGLSHQLRAAEAGCEKKCHDANRRGYAMGYAFADEKATKAFEAMRADLQRLSAENKGLLQQIEEDKQMVQRHLKEIAKEHAQMTAWEKKEIERLTAENKELERRVAEESHWCKHANLAARTAEMHAQMLRTDVAELKKENEGLTEENKKLEMKIERLEWENNQIEEVRQMLRTDVAELKKENEDLRKLVFPSLNLQAASSGVKLEPEVAPRITQVVQASPELVAALKAEKTWNDGVDIYYALTKKDYKDMIKAKGALPSVEVVEPDARLELLQCPLPDQLMECGSYECPPVQTEPEPVPEVKAKRPNYNHPNWPSPTTKRFAKHLAKHSGRRGQDPKTIKTHEDALEYIAKRGNISVETLLQWTMKHYQSFSEPWTLVEGPNKFNMGTAPATWWR